MSVALAQGLSLHGQRVCFIDLDPQASASTLFGLVPATEVQENQTVMPVVYGDETTLAYAPQPTYWPGIDLIPSAPHLFGADFTLPTRQVNNPEFRFWDVLEDAMAPLREKYDVIVIDTPPTLSYLASAAFMACDGMIVPIPPEALDYASSTMFFEQFAELFASFKRRGIDKSFDFVKVVLTKVKPKKAKDKVDSSDITRKFINTTYPELTMRNEIPLSDSISNAVAEFKTIYDLSSQTGSAKALTAMDGFVEEIENEIVATWASLNKE
jgi:chromosome partitioning protein